MKTLKDFCCLIGWHEWRYWNKFKRQCGNCNKRQMRVPYSMNNWFKY